MGAAAGSVSDYNVTPHSGMTKSLQSKPSM